MMDLDDFQYPAVHTQIKFGLGMIKELPGIVLSLGCSKVLIVSDSGIKRAGILERVADILTTAGLGTSVYDEIPQDSSTRHITEAAERLRKSGATCVIGLGGGSSMDAAKAVAVAATNPGPIAQYAGLNNVENNPLPNIAIPTTSGTGSEVSYWSVMTDDSTEAKIAVGGEKLFPTVAVCDPDLTIGLPPGITASTGLDALTHAVESYVNKSFQPISSVLTYRAIQLAGRYLAKAVQNGEDREARYGMMLSSTLAGLGMNPTRLGLVHALAMPLGSWDIKIAHGLANAILLPYSMDFNRISEPVKYAEVAVALGAEQGNRSNEELAKQSVEIVRRIVEKCGIPAGLGEVGLTEDRISQVCGEAMKSGNIPVNPRKVTQQDLEEICRRAL